MYQMQMLCIRYKCYAQIQMLGIRYKCCVSDANVMHRVQMVLNCIPVHHLLHIKFGNSWCKQKPKGYLNFWNCLGGQLSLWTKKRAKIIKQNCLLEGSLFGVSFENDDIDAKLGGASWRDCSVSLSVRGRSDVGNMISISVCKDEQARKLQATLEGCNPKLRIAG